MSDSTFLIQSKQCFSNLCVVYAAGDSGSIGGGGGGAFAFCFFPSIQTCKTHFFLCSFYCSFTFDLLGGFRSSWECALRASGLIIIFFFWIYLVWHNNNNISKHALRFENQFSCARCVRIDHRFNCENVKSNVNKMNNGLNQQRSLLETANWKM